jgi:hypothetical protein
MVAKAYTGVADMWEETITNHEKVTLRDLYKKDSTSLLASKARSMGYDLEEPVLFGRSGEKCQGGVCEILVDRFAFRSLRRVVEYRKRKATT